MNDKRHLGVLKTANQLSDKSHDQHYNYTHGIRNWGAITSCELLVAIDGHSGCTGSKAEFYARYKSMYITHKDAWRVARFLNSCRVALISSMLRNV